MSTKHPGIPWWRKPEIIVPGILAVLLAFLSWFFGTRPTQPLPTLSLHCQEVSRVRKGVPIFALGDPRLFGKIARQYNMPTPRSRLQLYGVKRYELCSLRNISSSSLKGVILGFRDYFTTPTGPDSYNFPPQKYLYAFDEIPKPLPSSFPRGYARGFVLSPEDRYEFAIGNPTPLNVWITPLQSATAVVPGTDKVLCAEVTLYGLSTPVGGLPAAPRAPYERYLQSYQGQVLELQKQPAYAVASSSPCLNTGDPVLEERSHN